MKLAELSKGGRRDLARLSKILERILGDSGIEAFSRALLFIRLSPVFLLVLILLFFPPLQKSYPHSYSVCV